MSLRQALNLVAYSFAEKAEGEHAQKLDSLFKGQITSDEFEAWMNDQTQNIDNPEGGITDSLLDELEQLRTERSGDRIEPG